MTVKRKEKFMVYLVNREDEFIVRASMNEEREHLAPSENGHRKV